MSVNAVQSNNVSSQVDQNNQSQTEQQILEQLLMLILSGGGNSDEAQKLTQELNQLASSLPPDQAKELKNLLSQLPSDLSNGAGEAFFSKVAAFLGSIMGLSSDEKKELDELLSKQPSDKNSKDYLSEMLEWGSKIAAFLASNLLGISPEELNAIMGKMPTNESDPNFNAEVMQFMSMLQTFIAENMPNSLSPSDKAELDKLEQEIQNVDLNSPEGQTELQQYQAELQVKIDQYFFQG